ncbi:MAG: LON peptidase substrate-binding domain-containing protein [Pseudomonadales bacterium]|nr:LON peptidase substrate-binding domain-containing protein [Pseudomonadales bacterium]
MVKAALFPIPGCVALPGINFPLHVFEPRYRKMVNYCVENKLPIAVCHTQKVLSEKNPQQTSQEALQSNQSTYKPCEIFSAGPVEIVDRMQDGRLAIIVHIDTRLKLKQQIQSLPFVIADCELYGDEQPTEHELTSAKASKDKILRRLKSITHEFPEAQEILSSDEWQQKPLTAFSFEVFNFLKLPAEITQNILEIRHMPQRLEAILSILNSEI